MFVWFQLKLVSEQVECLGLLACQLVFDAVTVVTHKGG